MSRKSDIFADIMMVLDAKEQELLFETKEWAAQRAVEGVFKDIGEMLMSLHQQVDPEFFEEYFSETTGDYKEELKPKTFS